MSSLQDDQTKIAVESEQEAKQPPVKRPMNAFMLWSKEKRRKISSVDPSLHNSHISKILGEEWKMLPLHEKDPYIKQSKTLMEKHKRDHPDYHYKPRQNKLTKALKEFSSLHSSLANPPGFASRIRSLSMSRYVHNTDHCTPYYGLDRSKMAFAREHELEGVPYHSLPAYYSRPLPCSSCTCTRECPESVSYRPHHPYRLPTRPSCKEIGSCYQDRSSLLERAWKLHSMASTSYGWSVPVLVNDGCVSDESRVDEFNDVDPGSSNGGDDEDEEREIERYEQCESIKSVRKPKKDTN